MKRLITLIAVLGMVLALAPAVEAATSDWTGASDTEWTTPGNWDNGVPNGAGEVANFGDLDMAIEVNVSSPITVGQIDDDTAWDADFLTALTASGTGQVTFDNSGSGALFAVANRFHSRAATYSVPMVLTEDTEFFFQTDRVWTLSALISGTGRLHLSVSHGGSQGQLLIGGSAGANTYQGGTLITESYSGSWNRPTLVVLDKDGALGTGDVALEVNTYGSTDGKVHVTITAGATTEDRIDDSASLYMERVDADFYTQLTLDAGVDETVAGLYFDGVAQLGGTWGATGSTPTPDYTNDNFFAGTGVLRVVIPPPAGTVLITK